MQRIKNILLTGVANRPMATDLFFETTLHHNPVVIYVHGFNGFKDWGNFDLIAERFALAGFTFIKFNFSHNGTLPGAPEEFTDLEAFGNNNYTKQLEDLRLVIDWVCDPANPHHAAINSDRICLIGHSMGGGISILQSARDARIKKLVTWAGISECKTPWGNWTAAQLLHWQQMGVAYYTNTRTRQQLPLYYQLYEDYIHHRELLDIKKSIQSLTIPILICQGSADTAVPVEKAYDLKSWQPAAQLFIVDSDHVFGRKHPWISHNLPDAMEAVVQESLRFLK